MQRDNIAIRVLLGILLAAAPSAARAGALVLYEGGLTDSAGTPRSGTFLLNFSIESGGEAWREAVFVRARAGRYRATLGAKTPIPDSALRDGFAITASAPSGADWISRPAAAALIVRDGSARPASAPGSGSAAAAAPETDEAGKPSIEFEGTLSDAQGVPKSGTFLMNFRIYPGISGEKLAWESARYVRIENGRFRTRLGEQTPLPVETLRGTYRILASGPAGLGWTAKASGVPVVRGIPPAPPVAATSGDAASATLEGMRAEMERVRQEALKAKRSAEASRKQVRALEQRMSLQPSQGAPQEPRSRIYVVRPGETLRSIAKKLFGSDARWVEIYQANHDRVLRGGEVVPGQKLLIPASGPDR